MKMKINIFKVFILLFILFVIYNIYSGIRFERLKTKLCGKTYEEKEELKDAPASWRLEPCLNKRLNGKSLSYTHYFMKNSLNCKILETTMINDDSKKIYTETWRCHTGIIVMDFDLRYEKNVLRGIYASND